MLAAVSGFSEFIQWTVIGLVVASVYAIAAGGLVVTYTTSGIFNFAHGAFGMVAAFTYWQIHFEWGWATWPSLLLVLGVIAPAFGALVERVIMRRLTDASDSVKVVVTVSLMIFLLGFANLVWKPRGRPFADFYDGNVVRIASVNVSYQRIITLIVAGLVAVCLRLILYKTRLGVAMRAVVDDRALTRLNGGRPDRVAMMSWALGSSLAALAGILVAPVLTLNSLSLTLLVVNTYAAAVVGRLRSLPMTFLGAVILALAETYVGAYVDANAYIGSFSLAALRFAVAPVMLFIVLAVLPAQRLRAGAAQRRREHWPVPSMPMAIGGAVGMVVATVALTALIAPVDMLLASGCMFSALVCVSLVPLAGYAGQISLAQLTFAGIGALVVSKIGADQSLVGVLLAVAVCAVVGAIVALPALRLTGIYLALSTAAFALLAVPVLFGQAKFIPNTNFQTPRVGIGSWRVESERAEVILMAVVFGLEAVGLAGLRSSRWGRRLAALKDSPVACATLGLNLTRTKVGVFALSAASAGLAGAVASKSFSRDQLQLTASLPFTMMAVVGGVGAIAGAFVGGMLLGGFGVLSALFKTNAIGLFRFFELSIPDATALMPGFIGVSLGRNPNGAVAEMAVGYRPVGRSRPALVVTIIGLSLLWVLAWRTVISNWTFVAAIVVTVIGIVPLLPALLQSGSGPRRSGALAFGVAALVGVCSFDWGDAIGSNGGRFVAIVVTAVAVGGISAAISGVSVESLPAPEVSPDLAGVDWPISRSDVMDADRALGIGPSDLRPRRSTGAETVEPALGMT